MQTVLTVSLSIALILLLSFTITTGLNVVFGPFLRRRLPVQKKPLISVLIPARNEEENIGTCLQSLLKQDYPALEIIVLNDHSEDRTDAIVQQFARNHDRIRLVQGKGLPAGWLGKNWACHQLSFYARGEILIFADADTIQHPEAVSRTAAWMHHLKLDMLSAFPQQITRSPMERLIVPGIDLLLYAFLTLWTTYYFKSSRFAAANGQWIAFDRRAYQHMGGHQTVRTAIVEDVTLSREAKRQGLRVLTLAGTSMVFCRMYHSNREVWEGFSKNAFGLTGHNSFLHFTFIAMMLTALILPYAALLYQPVRTLALILVGFNLVFRSMLAWRFKHPFFESVILNPVAVLLAILIALNSYFKTKFGRLTWKGRTINISDLSTNDDRPGDQA